MMSLMSFRARAGGTTSSATANTSASSTWKVRHATFAPDTDINILNVVMINPVLLIRPVNGSRYTASLRATGADWGLDTRIIF